MADVFISYAREDQPFVRELAEALISSGKDVWVDWEMPDATNWREEARAGIEASDSVVFVITRHSVESENCLYELVHAQAHSKRIITLRKDPLEAEELPPSVAPITWIDFADGTDPAAGWGRVLEAVDRDPAWVHGHTRWLQEALDWDRNRRDKSYLASGTELNEAEAWLTQADAGGREPPATPLHYEYILAGRRAATQRQRGLFLAVSIALGVAVALGANWFLERNEAREQRRVAISRLLANEAIAELDRRLDTGLLLGVAAYDVEQTPEARNSVLIGLRRSERILRFLPGTGRPVSAVSFDPGGERNILAGAYDDGRVWIWNLEERLPEEQRQPKKIGGHLSPVKGVALSGERGLLASVDERGNTLVRPIANKEETEDPLPDELVTVLAFAPGSATLALGTATGSVALWHPDGGVFFRRRIEGAPITALAFDRNGTSLAAGSRRGLVVLRLRDGRPEGEELRIGRGSAVMDLAFGGSDKLASVGTDRRVRAWTLNGTRAVARTLQAPEDFVSVAVGAAGDLVTGGEDGSITIWDRAWEESRARLSGHGNVVSDLAFDATGRTVASASNDGTIILWTLARTPFHRGVPVGAPDAAPLHPLFDLAFVSATSVVASALDESGEGRVVIVSLGGGGVRDLGHGPGSGVDLDVAPDGSRLAAAGQAGLVVWRLGDRPEREQLRTQEARRPATAVAFSGDADELAVAGDDGSIRIWRRPFREKPRILHKGKQGVDALAFSPPNRELLATGAANGSLTIWNVRDATSAQLPEPVDEPIQAVAFSPDGRFVAYGGGRTVAVWDVESWTEYSRFTPRVDALSDLAFSPRDGRWLALGDESGRIVFWDVAQRRSVGEPLETPEDEVVALDFRPDGSGLAAGASSGAVMLWDNVVWSADEAKGRICGLVARGLERAERDEFLPRGTDVNPCR